MEKQTPKSVQEALTFIARYVETAVRPVRMALYTAFSRVLAEDVHAPVSLPRFDNAAMDGFAIRSADLAENGSASLKVAQVIAAG